MEKHLISPNLANESRCGAVILSDNESISIMVNEEDHLRIQCLYPGFQIQEAWDLASRIDDIFEEMADYAFDEKRGFLTSCPTNVGTGIRASVMMHLPALVLYTANQSHFIRITQVGLAVRGIYGEGSEAWATCFKSRIRLLLDNPKKKSLRIFIVLLRQIIEHERAASQASVAGIDVATGGSGETLLRDFVPCCYHGFEGSSTAVIGCSAWG